MYGETSVRKVAKEIASIWESEYGSGWHGRYVSNLNLRSKKGLVCRLIYEGKRLFIHEVGAGNRKWGFQATETKYVKPILLDSMTRNRILERPLKSSKNTDGM